MTLASSPAPDATEPRLELDEVNLELQRFSFTGLLSLLQIKLSATSYSHAELRLLVSMRVPDRDDPSAEVPLEMIFFLHLSNLLGDRRGWRKALARAVRKKLLYFVAHEVDECFHVDGRRAVEPTGHSLRPVGARKAANEVGTR